MKPHLLFFLFFCTGLCGCGWPGEPDRPKDFYHTLAGWDIRYVPIIHPYKVSSTDGGSTWLLNSEELHQIEVSDFGVSKNFIYGSGPGGWFVFDTKTKWHAVYDNRPEMEESLHFFNLEVNPISSCTAYFEALGKNKDPYWFPEAGREYPAYPAVVPNAVVHLYLTDDAAGQPDFGPVKKPKTNSSRAYFINLHYPKPQNDLYYVSVNGAAPVLLRDSLQVPVFAKTGKLEVTLYTPYPVAQQKGIPENKRFLKSRSVDL